MGGWAGPPIVSLGELEASLPDGVLETSGATAVPPPATPPPAPVAGAAFGHRLGTEQAKEDEDQGREQERCCYALFTSGSTGFPLGVCGTELGIWNRCAWMQQAYPLGPVRGHWTLICCVSNLQICSREQVWKASLVDRGGGAAPQHDAHMHALVPTASMCMCSQGDRVAVKTAVSFVDSIWETLGPLLAGACMLLLPRSAVLHARELVQQLAAHGATHLVTIPSVLKLLLPELVKHQSTGEEGAEDLRLGRQGQEAEEEQVQGQNQGQETQQEGEQLVGKALTLRMVVSSGEPLTWALADALKQALPRSCTLLNLYGECLSSCICLGL